MHSLQQAPMFQRRRTWLLKINPALDDPNSEFWSHMPSCHGTPPHTHCWTVLGHKKNDGALQTCHTWQGVKKLWCNSPHRLLHKSKDKQTHSPLFGSPQDEKIILQTVMCNEKWILFYISIMQNQLLAPSHFAEPVVKRGRFEQHKIKLCV